ncbi:MAG: hypothetical protein GX754_09955 [Clostridiaceae bacterium]|jgi:hypothetical protein|nr:hypothetical protein [Clostridiaceae bacterium]
MEPGDGGKIPMVYTWKRESMAYARCTLNDIIRIQNKERRKERWLDYSV